jgi:hypothetical protein
MASAVVAEESPRMETPFRWLPDELLQYILALVGDRWVLTVAHAVCRRWRDQCRFIPVQISDRYDGTVDDDNVILPSTCPLHRVLSGMHRTTITEADRANMEMMAASWLINIGKRFRLVSFPLHRFRKGEALVAISTACRSLREIYIDMSYNYAVSPAVLKRISENCRELRTFRAETEYGASNHPVTEHFWGFDDNLSVVPEMFSSSLSSLILCNILHTSDAMLIAVAERCGARMTTVVLEEFRKIWIQASPNQRITDVGVTALALGCPNLRTLVLRDTCATDNGFVALARRCPKLREFHVGFSMPMDSCTDAIATALAENCRHLTSVELHGCAGVTSAGVSALAAALPGLRGISLDRTMVCGVGVRRLAQGCRRLKRVRLAGTQVDDGGVLTLIDSCPLLNYLDVKLCAYVTHVAMDYMAIHAPDLVDRRPGVHDISFW